MDRTRAAILAAEIETALRPLAAKHGLQIKARGGRFDATTYTAKIECSELQDGVAQTPERRDFASMAAMFGLKPEHLDATFDRGGETFKIVGLSAGRRRYPVATERVRDGKAFKFPANTVARALDGKAA